VTPALLLVDDEPLFLSSLADGLTRRLPHMKLFRAPDGAEALLILDREPIDLVITDLKMPVLDGFGLLARLHSRRSRTPVIVMSAYGTDATERRALAEGAIYCIDKPIDFDLLLVQIGDILSPSVAGTLRGVSLPAFLQLLAMERQSGVVQIRGVAGNTRLYLRDGEVVHAENGAEEGLALALRTLALEHVEIELRSEARSNRRTITMSMTALVLEAARIRDELTMDLPVDVDVVFDADLGESEPTTQPIPILDVPPPSTDQPPTRNQMNAKKTLEQAMMIEGAIGAALVDFQSGMTLGILGGGPTMNLELAAAGNTNVVRAKLKTMQSLGLKDRIEDILITLGGQYHLIRMFSKAPNLFLYLALNREHANLGMARYRLTELEAELTM
jgi:DNA-binding response OmpR family regulator